MTRSCSSCVEILLILFVFGLGIATGYSPSLRHSDPARPFPQAKPMVACVLRTGFAFTDDTYQLEQSMAWCLTFTTRDREDER